MIKKAIKKMGKRLPRKYKNLLLNNKMARKFVWRIYGLTMVEIPKTPDSSIPQMLLFNRAVDDLLIETRLLNLRVKILEEQLLNKNPSSE